MKTLNKIKYKLLSTIIVAIFFGIILKIFLISIFNLIWLLPLITGISACLSHILSLEFSHKRFSWKSFMVVGIIALIISSIFLLFRYHLFNNIWVVNMDEYLFVSIPCVSLISNIIIESDFFKVLLDKLSNYLFKVMYIEENQFSFLNSTPEKRGEVLYSASPKPEDINSSSPKPDNIDSSSPKPEGVRSSSPKPVGRAWGDGISKGESVGSRYDASNYTNTLSNSETISKIQEEYLGNERDKKDVRWPKEGHLKLRPTHVRTSPEYSWEQLLESQGTNESKVYREHRYTKEGLELSIYNARVKHITTRDSYVSHLNIADRLNIKAAYYTMHKNRPSNCWPEHVTKGTHLAMMRGSDAQVTIGSMIRFFENNREIFNR